MPRKPIVTTCRSTRCRHGSNPGFFRQQYGPSPCLDGRFSHSLWALAPLKRPVIEEEQWPETRLERSPDRAGSYRICRRELRLPIRVLALCRAVEEECCPDQGSWPKHCAIVP